MRKWLIGIAAVPLGAAALVAGIGALLPRTHVARADALMPAPVHAVGDLVRDVEAHPRWRPGVTAIELVERRGPRLRYIERSGGDAILFDLVEEASGTRFTSTIADPDLPFGGRWIIALAPEGNRTRVRIEEQGEVRNPVYRFFSALVFGHEATMKTYLSDMERALRR